MKLDEDGKERKGEEIMKISINIIMELGFILRLMGKFCGIKNREEYFRNIILVLIWRINWK